MRKIQYKLLNHCNLHCFANKKYLTIFAILCIAFTILHRLSQPGNVRYPSNIYGKNGTQHLPHAIIIGVQKGGTRAMLSFLNHHPDISVCGYEVKFFNIWRNYRQGIEWYRSQMPFIGPDQITIEKSPGYFDVSSVPERIYKMNSSVKLILVVREPVERAVSDFLQFERQFNGFRMLGYSFEDVAQSGSFWGYIGGFVDRSIYSKKIRKWLEIFPKEQILVVDGDKLGKDPLGELQRTEQFLAVKPFFKPEMFEINAKKHFSCFHAEPNAEPSCLGAFKGVPHPTIDTDLRRTLAGYFKPYNERLFQMIGRRFDWDLFTEI